MVDGRGKFLIPGLIDTHVHLALQRSGERDSLRALGAYLAHGVTGVREAGTGGREPWLLALRATSKDSVSPRIYVSGMIAGRTIKRAGTDARMLARRLIAFFDTSVDETRRIMDDDPGVRAGIFTYEVHVTRGFPGGCVELTPMRVRESERMGVPQVSGFPHPMRTEARENGPSRDLDLRHAAYTIAAADFARSRRTNF